MKVSVVVPAFNEENYIKDCLESILTQTVSPDEIIVVDNNSTDRTVQIAKKMGARVVKETRQGMIHARNKGFDSAKYEIIARCDADSRVPVDWIKRIKFNFENYDIDALSGPTIFYDYAIKSQLPVKIYTRFMKLLLRGNQTLIGPNMSLTKSSWLRVRNFVCLDDQKVHEDIDLSLNIFRIGGKIIHDNEVVVKISARRIKENPSSFFIEYPARLAKTLWINRAHKTI